MRNFSILNFCLNFFFIEDIDEKVEGLRKKGYWSISAKIPTMSTSTPLLINWADKLTNELKNQRYNGLSLLDNSTCYERKINNSNNWSRLGVLWCASWPVIFPQRERYRFPFSYSNKTKYNESKNSHNCDKLYRFSEQCTIVVLFIL